MSHPRNHYSAHDPYLLQLDTRRAKILEQAQTSAEQDGRDIHMQLVDEAGIQ